jgi:hypothetical protein
VNELFSIYLILPASIGPQAYSASNINEYQKQKEKFLGRRARQARKADNFTPSVSLLFGQYAILNISQPYRSLWPVTEITLLFYSLLTNSLPVKITKRILN